MNNILIEKCKDMLDNPDFEHNHFSSTATSIDKIGHESIRLMKWSAYSDRSDFENIGYYDLVGSVLNCLNKVSQR